MSQRFSYDVLGLGCVAVDDLLYVASYPPADAKMQVRRCERQCGGLTATALVAAARLGSRCAYAGVLGDDSQSDFVRATFRREGIDVSHVVHKPDARPIHSTIIVDETHQTRNIFFDLTGAAGADPELPAAEVIQSARVLYVDHFGIEGMTRAARIARAAGNSVVADFERNEWPGFDELLSMVDHLIVARDFAARLTGHADPVAALNQLWRKDRQVVVVTDGAAGCWYRTFLAGVPPIHQPTFPVPVVDTTGCGDVFHGAYAAALAWGCSIEERIRYAAAAAALKAMHAGGQAGIPTRGLVEALLVRVAAARED